MKQVDPNHYEFRRYVDRRRWSSMWHQIDEVLSFHPDSVIEVGPGPGLFQAAIKQLGVASYAIDFDPQLAPDCVANATSIPFRDFSVDVACAFQMLEHVPFESSIAAFAELCRVARKGVVISLPDAANCWPMTLSIPLLRRLEFIIPNPFFNPPTHCFNGQHYWEINKKGYELSRVRAELAKIAAGFSTRSYRVHGFPYHRFFVFARTTAS